LPRRLAVPIRHLRDQRSSEKRKLSLLPSSQGQKVGVSQMAASKPATTTPAAGKFRTARCTTPARKIRFCPRFKAGACTSSHHSGCGYMSRIQPTRSPRRLFFLGVPDTGSNRVDSDQPSQPPPGYKPPISPNKKGTRICCKSLSDHRIAGVCIDPVCAIVGVAFRRQVVTMSPAMGHPKSHSWTGASYRR
jgi:hypothetical protein